MARSKSNGNGRLEEAIAILLLNQAAFLSRASETDRQMAEANRINGDRFARIETMLIEHNRILADHTRILQALTDAISEKIGFKLPE